MGPQRLVERGCVCLSNPSKKSIARALWINGWSGPGSGGTPTSGKRGSGRSSPAARWAPSLPPSPPPSGGGHLGVFFSLPGANPPPRDFLRKPLARTYPVSLLGASLLPMYFSPSDIFKVVFLLLHVNPSKLSKSLYTCHAVWGVVALLFDL